MEEKKSCKECCRDITEEEAKQYNGFCKKCYNLSKQERQEVENEYEREGEKENKRINNVARIIKGIAIIGAIIGVILGCIQFDSYRTEELGWIYIISSVILAIFIYALGEIIQLLEDIKNK